MRLGWTRGRLRALSRQRQLWLARRSERPILHLLHVGKTGGTAVQQALTGARGSTHKIVLHPHRTTLCQVPVGEGVGLLLRDPTSRFVSGFNSRLRQGRPRYDVPWTPGERAAFAAFGTPDALGAALTSDDADVRRCAERAMNDIEHVRDQFSTWLGSPDYFLSRSADVCFIGRQESLTADVKRLVRLLGLDPGRQLSDSELLSHRAPAGSQTDLSPAAEANIRRWYADDYAVLALCRQHADELGYVPPD